MELLVRNGIDGAAIASWYVVVVEVQELEVQLLLGRNNIVALHARA